MGVSLCGLCAIAFFMATPLTRAWALVIQHTNGWYGGNTFEDNAPCDPEACCEPGGTGHGGGGIGGAGGGGVSGDGSDGATPDKPGPNVSCFRAPCNGGMPTWYVTEPEVNLWLEDQPLLYRPSLGPAVRVFLRYKDQSGNQDDFRRFDPNVFSVGARWSFSLRSYVETNVSLNAQAWLFTGDGRAIKYNLGAGNIEYTTRSTLVWATNQFILSHPDGSKEYFSVGTSGEDMLTQTSVNRYFLRTKTDPQGNALTFNYTTNGTVKLNSVVDANNRTTQITYLTSHPVFGALVWKVTDPDTNVVEFKYSDAGCLTNIIDVAGIDSRMEYDGSQNLLRLKTPYGQTTFDFPMTNSMTAYRAIKITEATGGEYLFVSGKQFDSTKVPASGTPPPTSAKGYSNTFNNGNLDYWNSFVWGPRQYGLLSSTVANLLANNDPSFVAQLTATDYRRARMRHWLTRGGYFGTTLALERDPSPDGTTDGRKTWYDHEGKSGTNNEVEGTMKLPRCVAVTLPNNANESSFVWTTRNALGNPTREVSTYTDANGQWQTRTNGYGYSADGLDLLTHTNAAGVLVSSNLYTSAHTVATNWNALGEMTVFTYNAKQQVIRVARPGGWITTNLYFTSGTYTDWLNKVLDYEVVSNTNRYYRTNEFTYAGGRLYTRTDERGLVVTHYWDALGRLKGQADAQGWVTNYYTLSSNPYANSSGGTSILDVTKSIDRKGFTNTYTYDGLRQLTALTDANNHVTQYDYCTCGALDTVTTPMNNVTSYLYDDAGRLVTTVLPSGVRRANAFDGLNRLLVVADPWGAITNTYNNQGGIVTVSNALGRLSSVTYDVLDRISSQADANGVVTSYAYDDLGRTHTRLVSGTATETFNYNARGLTNYIDPLGTNTWYVYDALRRKIAETNGNSEVTQFAYSPAGDLWALTDGRQKTTNWRYDEYGRVTNKVDHNSVEILRYQYDVGGCLTNRWTKAKGNTAYTYDPVGNLRVVDYPAGTTDLSFDYDGDNRLTTMVDGTGTTAYSYANGLLVAEDGSWANDTVSYGYQNDLCSALTLLQPNAAAWGESYGYDSARRLTAVTSPAGTFGYTYAGPGSLVTNLALPGSLAITNQFDSVGRLSGTWLRSATNTVLNTHQYTYNAASQRTRQTRLAGDYVDYTYDGAGQLKTAIGKESGGGTSRVHEQFGYAYDAGGNLQYRTNNALVQTFSVDNVNELTGVSRSGTLTVAGGTTGPATSVTVNGQTATRYGDNTFALGGFTLTGGPDTFTAVATDNINRWDTNTVTVTLPASVSCTYDDNGNLTSDGQRSFEYDAENQLTAVQVAGAWRSEFKYDGKLRRRVRTEKLWAGSAFVTASETRYVYDGMLVLQERDANNVPLITYTRGSDLSGSLEGAGGIGGLLARTSNSYLLTSDSSSAHAFYHADGNGNITALVNGLGSVVARYLYDPYGNLLAKGGALADANLYRFSSKELHANSGLYYYGYRYYEPALQRWLTMDPADEDSGINLYMFLSNAPPQRYDAYGLSDENRPPIVVTTDQAKYGRPYCPTPEQCKALLDRIMRKAAELEKDLAKYDPVEDGKGGHPKKGGGTTIPGGHYREIEQRQRGLRRDISNYLRNCFRDGGGGLPGVPQNVIEQSNRKVALPVFPRVIILPPLPIPVPVPVPVPI